MTKKIMRSGRAKADCDCGRCTGNPNAHPVWGYDTTKVPTATCALCGKVIGDGPFVLSSGVARFGIMEVLHVRCDKGGKARKETAQRLKKWTRDLEKEKGAKDEH